MKSVIVLRHCYIKASLNFFSSLQFMLSKSKNFVNKVASYSYQQLHSKIYYDNLILPIYTGGIGYE